MVRLGPNETVRLAEAASYIMERAERLVALTDRDRQGARMSGVETIAIELSGILEGRRLAAVVDALDDALSRQTALDLSEDGLALLRRSERLVAEAERRVPAASSSLSGASTRMVAQADVPSSGFSTAATFAVIALGIMGIGALGALIYFSVRQRK